MASQDTPCPEQELAQLRHRQYESAKSTLAKVLLVACPVLIFMPPRRLNLFTMALTGSWVTSADHILEESTGRNIFQHIAMRAARPSEENNLPTEKARQLHKLFKEQKEQDLADKAEKNRLLGLAATSTTPQSGERLDDEHERGKRSVLQKVWMGDEKEGWKERRIREEREALAEGKGYWDLITDQIWEVWSWEKQGGKDNPSTDGEDKER